MQPCLAPASDEADTLPVQYSAVSKVEHIFSGIYRTSIGWVLPSISEKPNETLHGVS